MVGCVAFSAKSGNTDAVPRRFPVFRLRISVYPDYILYRRTLRILVRQFVIRSAFATRRTGTDALRRFRPERNGAAVVHGRGRLDAGGTEASFPTRNSAER